MHPTLGRTRSILAIGLMVIVGACGGSSTPAPAGQPTANAGASSGAGASGGGLGGSVSAACLKLVSVAEVGQALGVGDAVAGTGGPSGAGLGCFFNGKNGTIKVQIFTYPGPDLVAFEQLFWHASYGTFEKLSGIGDDAKYHSVLGAMAENAGTGVLVTVADTTTSTDMKAASVTILGLVVSRL